MLRTRVKAAAGNYDYTKAAKSLDGNIEDEDELLMKEHLMDARKPLTVAPSPEDSDSSEDEDDDEEPDEVDYHSLEEPSAKDPFDKALDSAGSSDKEHRRHDKKLNLGPLRSFQELKTQEDYEDQLVKLVSVTVAQLGWNLDPLSVARTKTGMRVGLNLVRGRTDSVSDGGSTSDGEAVNGLLRSQEPAVPTPQELTAFYDMMVIKLEQGIKFPKRNGKGWMELSFKTPGLNPDLLKKLCEQSLIEEEVIKGLLTELRLYSMVHKYCNYP
uniref:Phosphoprotein n=1 Tax=Longquan Niviventer coninga ledantevirus 1 TaxID=2877507 RepID=A0A9E8YX90_9RHAB|nr:MAG: putative phosphoprotein [Longquan Niviventer coninga ledantevirus 1]